MSWEHTINMVKLLKTRNITNKTIKLASVDKKLHVSSLSQMWKRPNVHATSFKFQYTVLIIYTWNTWDNKQMHDLDSMCVYECIPELCHTTIVPELPYPGTHVAQKQKVFRSSIGTKNSWRMEDLVELLSATINPTAVQLLFVSAMGKVKEN